MQGVFSVRVFRFSALGFSCWPRDHGKRREESLFVFVTRKEYIQACYQTLSIRSQALEQCYSSDRFLFSKRHVCANASMRSTGTLVEIDPK